MILSPHFTDLRQGPGPSLSRAVSACPVVPRHYIAGTLMVNPTSITLAGTPWADPTSTNDRGEGQGNRVSITSRGNLRNHPRWIPTRCNRQGDLGGITLEGFRLEVSHNNSSSGVVNKKKQSVCILQMFKMY